MTTEIASGNQGSRADTGDAPTSHRVPRPPACSACWRSLGFAAARCFWRSSSRPADANQGDAVRIIYVHVPSATFAYVGCFVTTARRRRMYLLEASRSGGTLVADAGAEIGVLFTALTLVTGMLWGRPTWGIYWIWDARLTSTAMLMLLLLGYLALRRLPADSDGAGQAGRDRRPARCVPNVLIVH